MQLGIGDTGDFNTPEVAPPLNSSNYLPFLKQNMHGLGVALTGLPVGAASLAAFPGPQEEGIGKYIPGVASGAYSMIDAIPHIVQRLAGTPEADVYHLPGGVEAGRLNDASMDAASRIVPHVQPMNDEEQQVQDVSKSVGSMLPELPAAAMAKIPTMLGRGVVGMGLMGPKAVIPSLTAQAVLPSLLGDSAQAATTDKPLGLFDPNPTPASTAQPSKSLGLFDPPTAADGEHQLFAPATQAELDPSELTWRQALTGVGVGVAVLLAGRRVSKFGLDLAKEKYFSDSDRINTNIAADGTPGETVPLPGTAQSGVTATRQASLDDTAKAKEYLKSTADSPTIGMQLQYKYGDITNDQVRHNRYQSGVESGEMHGQQMPSLKDWYLNYSRLTPDQQSVMNTAMHSGNEVDNRYANWMSKGRTTDDIDQRVNFPDKTIQQLRTDLNAGLADPQIKALIDTHKLQTDANVDMLVKQGQMSVSEGARLKSAHNYFVPASDMDNIITNPMNARNLVPYSGSSTLPDFIQLKDQHQYALYKAVDVNNARDMIVSQALKWQAKDADPMRPGVKNAELFKASKDQATGEWVAKKDGSSLAVRRNGELQHYDVYNRSFLDALQGSNSQVGSLLSGISKLRQASQSTMTGALSVLSGHFFPSINADRSALEASITRPSGMVGGYGDKLLQHVSGGRLEWRGDPTSLIGTQYHKIAGPLAEQSRMISELFAPNANNMINTRMRSMFGDNAFNLIAQRAKTVYDQSTRAAMRESGTINSAGVTANDVRSQADFMKGDAGAIMPSYDMVPEAFQANRLGGAMPTIVRMRSWFNELKGSIGDAGHANFYSMNKDRAGVTPEMLRYETRNATGDPSLHGDGKFGAGMDAVVPFRNVAKQEGGRVARSLNEAPIPTMLGYVSAYGSVALASVLTAMMVGPEAIRHLFDSTTDAEKSANAHLYIPGMPTNPIKLPLQINMRGPYPFMVQMFYDLFSLPSHAEDVTTADRVQSGILDFFDKHVHVSTINAAIHGVSDGVIPNVPVGFPGVVTAITGKSIDPTVYNAYMHTDQPLTQKFSYDITGQNSARTPGLPSGRIDPVTGTMDGNAVQHIISDVFATTGALVLGSMKQYANVTKAGGNMGDVVHNIMQQYKLNIADSVPGVAALWGVPEKLGSNTPLQERVEGIMDKIRPMMQFKSDVVNLGHTRAKGPSLIVPTDPNVPSDPTMRSMYVTAGKYAELLTTKPGSPLKAVQDDRKQIAALDRSPMDPVSVREAKNGYINSMQDNYVKVMAHLHQMNEELSKIAGVPVDVRKIDWKKGVEQFAAPPQQ